MNCTLLKSNMITLQDSVLLLQLKLLKSSYCTKHNQFYRKDHEKVLFSYGNLLWILLACKRPTTNQSLNFQWDKNAFGWNPFKLCLEQDSRIGSEKAGLRLNLWPKQTHDDKNDSNNIAVFVKSKRKKKKIITPTGPLHLIQVEISKYS